MSLKKTQAWKWFSKYVRKKAADFQGYAACFTCGVVKPWQELEAGHYIHARLGTFFDEMNVNPQCTRCNKWLHGNLGEYENRLLKKYGENELNKMKMRAQIKRKVFSDLELKVMSKDYKQKFETII